MDRLSDIIRREQVDAPPGHYRGEIRPNPRDIRGEVARATTDFGEMIGTVLGIKRWAYDREDALNDAEIAALSGCVETLIAALEALDETIAAMGAAPVREDGP